MKNNIKTSLIITALGLLTSFSSCQKKEFKITGEISDAQGDYIVLEKSDFQGFWNPLDSTKIKDNGKFAIAFPAPPAPEIYRLKLGKDFIYVPIDSTETINIIANKQSLSKDYTISGSENAERLARFEKDILDLSLPMPSDSLYQLKRDIYTKYMMNFPGSIVTYYILTKTIDGKSLYSPSDTGDAKYFGAVATGFKSTRPDDPRTQLLERTSLNSLKMRNNELGKMVSYEAEEVKLIDIELPDEKGNIIKLSDIAGKGKPTVLIFSYLTLPDSPEFNYQLAQVYEKFKGNVEFYNVCFDPDQFSWRESAANIPWITVYSPTGLNTDIVGKYNLQEIPSIYIYNKEGELSARASSIADIEKKL